MKNCLTNYRGHVFLFISLSLFKGLLRVLFKILGCLESILSLGKNGAAHGVACGLSNPQAKLEAQTGSLEAKCLVVHEARSAEKERSFR